MSVADIRKPAVDGMQGKAARLEATMAAALLEYMWRRWLSFAFVEQMFIVLRLLAIPSVLVWLWFNPHRDQLFDRIVSLLALFAIYNAVVHIAAFTLPIDRLRRFQFLEVLCDLLFITLLLNGTGTVVGIFQFGYMLLIIFSSYYFQMQSAMLLVAISFVLSLLFNATNGEDIYWGDTALLAGFEVLVAAGVGVMARKDRREREGMENLNRQLQVRSAELMQAYRSILSSWASAVDAKDTYTRGHAERVSGLAKSIAEAMGLLPEECDKIAVAALLHDVGKIAVPDSILGKTSRLSTEEWVIVRQHPSAGATMISRVEALKDLAPLIMSHHERADGSGYPQGARLEDIPLGARIIAVADVYDAMTSERIYRPALHRDEAVGKLMAESSESFDPEVVRAFLNIIERMPRVEREQPVGARSGPFY